MTVALLSLTAAASASFEPATHFDAGDGPIQVATADLDGDGSKDLAIANAESDDLTISIGAGDGTFAAPVSYPAGDEPSAVAIGQLSGDNSLDVAVSNHGSNDISIFGGNGDGTFAEAEQLATTPATGVGDVSIADMNEDSRMDLVFSAPGNSRAGVMIQDSNGDFGPARTVDLGFSVGNLAVDDLTADDRPEVVVTRPGQNQITIMDAAANGELLIGSSKAVGINPEDVAIGNVDQDDGLEIVVASSGDGGHGGSFTVFRGLGDTGDVHDVAGRPDSLLIEELNGGFTSKDLALADSTNDRVMLVIGSGDGRSFWPDPNTYPTGDGSVSVAAGDFNGDELTDLVTADQGADQISILLEIGPTPEFDPTGLAFPDKAVGKYTAPKYFQATNSSPDYWLDFTDVRIIGPDADSFVIAGSEDTCNSYVIGGPMNCMTPVKFKPEAIGPAEASLELTYKGKGSPITVPLSGTGTEPEPEVICPAVLYHQEISDFDPSPPFGQGKRVNGIRVELTAPPGMVSRIRPLMRYGYGSKELTVHLQERTIRVNGHNRMRFLLPREITKRIRNEGKRIKGSTIRFRLNSKIYYPGGIECAQTSALILKTKVVGVSKRAGLRRLFR
jgi:hypothetical protein